MKAPEFQIEDIEDAYTYYVLILGIPSDFFWHSELSEILSVALNKISYDYWIAGAQREMIEKQRG